uniref:Sodefrin-like factor n=1 Tax=Ichthyosaura alpestris TaxID=54263 RepID=A0A0F7JH31_ICHAP|nr:sodefrin precursor-like factor [Ichthyosaura alpestris]
MRFFAAGAILFLVFIAAGNAIQCETCVDLANKNCYGELVTCAKNVKGCLSALSEYSKEGVKPVYTSFKNCSALRTKNAMYRSAIRKSSYQLKVQVCQKSGCSKTPLQLPPKNKTLNGVKCPTCNVTGALTCEADGVVQCVGEMTHCIYMAATFYRSELPPTETSAYRGCTSAKSKHDYPEDILYRLQSIETLEISKGV